MWWLAILGVVALIASYLGVGAIRAWAERSGVLDVPNERSSHTRPTPRGGGLAILVVTLVGLVVTWVFVPEWGLAALLAYLAGAILIAVVSWLDDRKVLTMSVGWRFAAHFAGAGLGILAFGYLQTVQLPLLPAFDIALLGLPLCFIWLVGLTNAYNFMDGIDGIAGGQSVVAGAGWALLGIAYDLPLVAALGVLLAAASLGFLGHNWPPASIFMGDVSSAFLGFTFALLAIIGGQERPDFAVAGVLFVWPFLFDSGFTFLRRLLRRENVFAAHRTHLYQRLVIVGHRAATVSLLYIGLAVVGVVAAFAWIAGVPGGDFIAALAAPLLALLLWLFVLREERRRAMPAARDDQPLPSTKRP